MQLHVSEDLDHLSRQAADWMVSLIANTLQRQDRFTIALSGGSSPVPLHKLLASDEYRDRIDWPKLHFFWGDERFVPFEDERSNARMAFETLLDHVPVEHSQIHVISTENIEPHESAEEYQDLLMHYFGNTGPGLDLNILGIGDNAHTLSLFPGYPIVHETQKWVDAFWLEEQDMYRVTMTAPFANRSVNTAFLVSGASKQPALKAILEGPRDADKYPAQLIQPESGQLDWFVDKAAAGEPAA